MLKTNFVDVFAVVQSLFGEIDNKTCVNENSDEKLQSFHVSVRYRSLHCALDPTMVKHDDFQVFLWLLACCKNNYNIVMNSRFTVMPISSCRPNLQALKLERHLFIVFDHWSPA